MVKFLNGPAHVCFLALQRAPFFLRVTCAPTDRWDGLDQQDDEPRLDEVIYAYRLVESRGLVHLQLATPDGRRGVWTQSASYRAVVPQPDDATMRSNDRWRDWCWAQANPEGVAP